MDDNELPKKKSIKNLKGEEIQEEQKRYGKMTFGRKEQAKGSKPFSFRPSHTAQVPSPDVEIIIFISIY